MSCATVDEPWLLADLSALVLSDEASARTAFDRLWTSTRSRVARQLARRGLDGHDAQDVAQEVALRLWRARQSVRAATVGQWFALVHKTVFYALAECGRSPHGGDLAELAEIPEADIAVLEAFLGDRDEYRRAFECADRLWLGEAVADGDLPATCAILILVEGMEPSDVASIFGVPTENVRSWLAQPEVVLRAAFRALCWSRDALASYVLRPERPLSKDQLRAVVERANARPKTDWNDHEERIVVRRLRYGMVPDAIARAEGLAREEIEAVLDRIRTAFPFGRIALSLRERLKADGLETILANTDLWKRLAFEYHARYDLPHGLILELIGPAAEAVGASINLKTLENWLSQGRIYRQLAERLRKEGA